MLTRIRDRWRAFRPHLTWAVAWDLIMVYLALVNLGLILFDFTYLWLRPTYLNVIPVVTRIYDPVKGIEPEPVTQRYLELIDSLAVELETDPSGPEVRQALFELRELSAEMLDDNPFERSGLERNLIQMGWGMAFLLEEEGIAGVDDFEAHELLDLFWSLEPEPSRLPMRVERFESELAPLLEANFFRRYGPNGELVDHFWWIDLPFLIIFVVEFFTRWYLAIRRRAYPRWFFFPIFNWYDVLGILPFKQTRLFRLFRVVSIYIRLHRSDYSKVGDDPISRTVKYFSNIISEEISDMVSLRILNETQEELREGTHKRVIRSVANSHRDALAAQLAKQARQLLDSDEVRAQARGLLDANLERAVDSAAALRRLPLPNRVLQPLVESIGGAVFDAFADTMAATLASDEGKEAVEALIADSIDGLVEEATEGELEEIIREISIEVIGHMKETVSVRKWALPDQPRRSIFTRDLIE
jgi:hypothetical protein